jgi:hypothetical protein
MSPLFEPHPAEFYTQVLPEVVSARARGPTHAPQELSVQVQKLVITTLELTDAPVPEAAD